MCVCIIAYMETGSESGSRPAIRTLTRSLASGGLLAGSSHTCIHVQLGASYIARNKDRKT